MSARFLDTATDDQLTAALYAAAQAALPIVFHTDVVARRVRFIRHALNHLLRATDPLPDRMTRCVNPGEVYFVPGLGPAFWAAALAATDPEGAPVWCPATELGLQRLGLLRDTEGDLRARFAALAAAFGSVREHAPDLRPPDVAEFLERVSRVSGRELPPAPAEPGALARGGDSQSGRTRGA